MARRKSHDKDEQETKSRRGPPSYPYVVYATWPIPHSTEIRWLILKFKDAWGARNMIHALTHNLMGGSEYELKRSPSGTWNYMLLENGMRISLRDDEQQQQVMELDFDESEAYVSDEVRYFKYGSSFEGARRNGDTPPSDGAEVNVHRVKRTKSHRPDKESSGDSVPKERKRKVDKAGLVTANDLAGRMGLAGREVRGVLRALKMVKPEGGWAWTPDEAAALEVKIKDNLKKAKKK